MRLQIINDTKGNTTGIYISIEEWEKLKKKYKDLESMEYIELIHILMCWEDCLPFP